MAKSKVRVKSNYWTTKNNHLPKQKGRNKITNK